MPRLKQNVDKTSEVSFVYLLMKTSSRELEGITAAEGVGLLPTFGVGLCIAAAILGRWLRDDGTWVSLFRCRERSGCSGLVWTLEGGFALVLIIHLVVGTALLATEHSVCSRTLITCGRI
jgi:hypothetical protein